jgi:hypothetical protein
MVALVVGVTATLGFVALGLGVVLGKRPPVSPAPKPSRMHALGTSGRMG